MFNTFKFNSPGSVTSVSSSIMNSSGNNISSIIEGRPDFGESPGTSNDSGFKPEETTSGAR